MKAALMTSKRGLNVRLSVLAAVAGFSLAAAAGPAVGSSGATVLYALVPPNGFGLSSDQQTGGGQVVGFGYGGAAGTNNHAAVWSGTLGTVDLNPTALGVTTSFAYGTDGSQQVGEADFGTQIHAILWSGTAGSAVDLNPSASLSPGFTSSWAYGIGGTQQVGGYGNLGGSFHAILWNGTAASAVDLNPTSLGITNSIGEGTNGAQQVGYGSGSDHNNHALLWNGTAASAVDLNPTNPSLGITESSANGTDGTQQVGDGYGSGTAGDPNALLWSGTAASAVNLNPTSLGITLSFAWGINGNIQVGEGWGSGTNDAPHALMWNGTAASVVDLNSLLPQSGVWISSDAFTADSSGDVFGTAQGNYDGYSGTFAVEWSPVPEPADLSLLALGGVTLLARRRREGKPNGQF